MLLRDDSYHTGFHTGTEGKADVAMLFALSGWVPILGSEIVPGDMCPLALDCKRMSELQSNT